MNVIKSNTYIVFVFRVTIKEIKNIFPYNLAKVWRREIAWEHGHEVTAANVF